MFKLIGDYATVNAPRRCECCGKRIKEPARSDKRFCSSICRVKCWRVRHAS